MFNSLTDKIDKLGAIHVIDNNSIEIISNIFLITFVLINTSYNIHGRPIAWTREQAIDDFKFQLQKAEENNIDKEKLHLVIADEII